eukprot:85915_1
MADTDLFTEQIVSSMSQQEIEEMKSTVQDATTFRDKLFDQLREQKREKFALLWHSEQYDSDAFVDDCYDHNYLNDLDSHSNILLALNDSNSCAPTRVWVKEYAYECMLQDGRISMDPFTLLFEIYNERAQPPFIIPAIETLNFDRQLNLLNSSQFEVPDLPRKYRRECNPMIRAYFKSRSELKMTRVEEWTSKEVPISLFIYLIGCYLQRYVSQHTPQYLLFIHYLYQFCKEESVDSQCLNTDDKRNELIDQIYRKYSLEMSSSVRVKRIVSLWWNHEIRRSQSIDNAIAALIERTHAIDNVIASIPRNVCLQIVATYRNTQKISTNLDKLMDDLALKNMKTEKIVKMLLFLYLEEYDSDTLQRDVLASKEHAHAHSNILFSCFHEDAEGDLVKQWVYDGDASKTWFFPGILYWYWPHYKTRQFDEDKEYDTHQLTITGVYIKPKYVNLKEEFTEFCDMERWERIRDKSEELISMESAKRIKSANRDSELHYNIPRNTPLSIANLQAICVYCDLPYIRDQFLSTFQPQDKDETISSVIKGHESFYFLSKTLRETVQYFGDNIYTHHHGPFFYLNDRGDSAFTLQSFSLSYNAPLSVSCQIEAAMRFSGSDGNIMQLQNDGDYVSRNQMRFFDCSWISRYREDDERLFFDPGYSLRVVSIRTQDDAGTHNFQLFFTRFYLLDCMVSGTNMEGSKIQHKPKKSRKLLIALLTVSRDTRIPEYVYDTFYSFCTNKTQITIDIHMLDLYFKNIADIMYGIVREDGDCNAHNYDKNANINLVKHDVIKLFKNVQEWTLITTSSDGSAAYSFSLEALLNILCNSASPYLRIVTVKAWWDRDNVFSFRHGQTQTWISSLWHEQSTNLIRMYAVKGWEICLKQAANTKEDWLIIKRQRSASQDLVIEYKEEMKQGDDVECFVHKMNSSEKFIENCGFLKRLITAIAQYKQVQRQNESNEAFFQSSACAHVLDDYIHLVRTHDDQIQDIYLELMRDESDNALKCEDKQCAIRNRRNMRQRDDRKGAGFYLQLFDTIHCYLLHLFDSGLRRVKKSEHDDDDDANILQCEEEHIANVSKFTMQTESTTASSAFNILGMCRYLMKHKATVADMQRLYLFLEKEGYDSEAINHDLACFALNQKSNIANQVNETMLFVMQRYTQNIKVTAASFSTGFIFYYWPYYESFDETEQIENENNINDHGGYAVRQLYIKTPKHNESFKEEILYYSNDKDDIASPQPNTDIYQAVYAKAMRYMNTKEVKSRSSVHQEHLHYDIKPGTPFALQNVMSLLIYCDFTNLCTKFSATFRFIPADDSLQSVKARNSAYWWLSKILRETVQLFGSNRYDAHGPFYCGMNFLMYIYQFNIRLCGPTSTTSSKDATATFHEGNGIIIQFNNNGDSYNSKRLRFFDCSWLSDYPDEAERLFFGGDFRIRIESVTVIETKMPYKSAFHALYLFDCMVTASNMKGCKVSIKAKDKEILEALIGYELGLIAKKSYDEYVHDTFHAFCIKKTQIIVNINQLDWYFRDHDLYKLMMCDGDNTDGDTMADDSIGARYSSNSKHDNTKRNILNAKMFKLFENATEFTIYTTDRKGLTSYSFDLELFLSVANESNHWRQIVIKGVYDEADVHKYNQQTSWISDAFDEFKVNGKDKDWKQYDIVCKQTTTSDKKKEDSLIIKHNFWK